MGLTDSLLSRQVRENACKPGPEPTPRRGGRPSWHHVAIMAACLWLLAGCASTGKQPEVAIDTLTVPGTPAFCEQVRKALVLMKTRSPASYTVVTNYIGVIRQYKHSGMRANANPPCFDLNDQSAFYSLTWCAGVIAHDSFHSKLFHDEKAKGSSPSRQVWTGHEAETKCLAHQVQALTDVGAPEREIKHCQTTSLQYSDVTYRKRNW